VEQVRNQLLRAIPSVHSILESPPCKELMGRYSCGQVTRVLTAAIEEYRGEILSLPSQRLAEARRRATDLNYWCDICEKRLTRLHSPGLRRVINATGVVVHTNLGRAPLSQEALEQIADACSGYSNLEYDLKDGRRGSRYAHLVETLTWLSGAEDALVVNNNAAAVLLTLAALAGDEGEVLVSRGELVEIGGSFRIPEILAQSGARLVEVGTTNRTHLADYRRAVGERTAVLLKVHTSNYRVVGFTCEVPLADLCGLGREVGLPVVNDLGSGVMPVVSDLNGLAAGVEPSVPEAIAQGADVLTFSGDKLLGGPQAGLILGCRRYLEAMREHPLLRALRVGKMTLAALDATLRCYLDPAMALQSIPALRMSVMGAGRLRDLAGEMARELKVAVHHCGGEVWVEEAFSRVGGGAFPLAELPTHVVVVRLPGWSAGALAAALRGGEPSVVVTVRDDGVRLDPRTMLPGDQSDVTARFSAISRSRPKGGAGGVGTR